MKFTILFGTESGNAELVAEDLSDSITEDGVDEVEVLDMSEVDASSLDRSAFHLIICSTYGDGELPVGAKPFHESLLAEQPDLSGLHYAVFGLGDRSYTETYSRGSEIIDEQLARLGAVREGEYGRHDAGSFEDASESAIEWFAGVREQVAAHAG